MNATIINTPDASRRAQEKLAAARAALAELPGQNGVLGVGSGSTVHAFIAALAETGRQDLRCVASSVETAQRLKTAGFQVVALDSVRKVDVYVDGADEIDANGAMIKGGGAALTQEKIVASAAARFACIADSSKKVAVLGAFPVPVEIIAMAQALIARQIAERWGGVARLRKGVITDNGHPILDIEGLEIHNPTEYEAALNSLAGVVTNGIFARHAAHCAYIATASSKTEGEIKGDRACTVQYHDFSKNIRRETHGGVSAGDGLPTSV